MAIITAAGNMPALVTGVTNATKTADTVSLDDVITGRRQRVETMCQRFFTRTNAMLEISGIRRANMSYCVVQKAGCTMWIRLFKYFEGQNYERGSPMTLTKYQVHYERADLYKRYTIYNGDQFVKRSHRVMTVRHPFTRIWSAFIDKFLLPDFWFSKGTQIVRTVRPKASKKSLQCGNDVTFPEFVKYLLKIGHQRTYVNQDKHWLPASDICDPCAFKPDIIAKHETFITDLEYTVNRIGLGNLINSFKVEDPTKFEIRDEIDYNFHIYDTFKSCLTKRELAERLWNAFILNGYILANQTFPKELQEDKITAASFEELVTDGRAKFTLSHEEKKAIRKRVLSTAFKEIPHSDMNRLRDLYKNDFDLFDYDPFPEFVPT
ncbi:hypothetical protein DPMN_030865 [Dreissena polymorpha]|uniref:Carbohydrate sulfotransferase n=2 Tax=Dreissena polymorpha TaxID=45954 RepID=A0A9D4M0S2_DREPO|nr:hypothetical protein DPMN_030865 [Dreissena polymorpha]